MQLGPRLFSFLDSKEARGDETYTIEITVSGSERNPIILGSKRLELKVGFSRSLRGTDDFWGFLKPEEVMLGCLKEDSKCLCKLV